MSTRELKLKINQMSKNFLEVLEKEEDAEKKIKLFENFYTTLNLIQDMYNPVRNLEGLKKRGLN